MSATTQEPITQKVLDGVTSHGSGDVELAMAIAAGPYGKFHEPIHESLTLSALISSGLDIGRGTTIENVSNSDWEYVRGAVWNDDPDCQLFADKSDENHKYDLVGGWWVKYYFQGKGDWEPGSLSGSRYHNPTGRSHFGDLQFLHCMASVVGEKPEETKQKVMDWMEVMYKLANGEDGITPATKIGDTKLRGLFKVTPSLPQKFRPLFYLLAKETPFQGVDIRRRALGSMFHVIQDSYALGHTRRKPMNKESKSADKNVTDPLRFQKGVADRWGAIENFHTYFGQNGSQHEHYDHTDDEIPDPNNLDNLDQWNDLIGCRDAVEKCKALALLKRAGKTWDEDKGVREFLDTEVFVLAEDATPANNHVDV
ncbi:serine protease abc transporter b family tagd [Fusarium acutatum]|uniref:Serine protease abc transporter b family tagd n=1 Tax=Fusarium acutatum TaxID=78861 RepID=A0A8H4K9G7_9HYPO|nr:serine protease abc transporter b family tagd [Fusarium acutatum]